MTDEVRWPGDDLLAPWPGLAAVAAVEWTRAVAGGGTSTERRYFITSLRGADAAAVLAAVRGHWAVENKLHWQLDVSFREDECRVRAGHAAENLSRLRRLALDLLQQDRSVKNGVAAKRLKAWWDEHCLLRLLTS